MSDFLRPIKKFGKNVLQRIADLIVRRSTVLPDLIQKQTVETIQKQFSSSLQSDFDENFDRALNTRPSPSARFLPLNSGKFNMLVPGVFPAGEIDQQDGLPIPPPELWAGYGTNSTEYVESGRVHFRSMLQVLEDSGFGLASTKRVLDFGCAAGRMTRNFHRTRAEQEVWGADLNASAILWCQQHLSPPLHFLTSTTFPHLPFEDQYFDLIYAGSVFTHIGDLEDTWLLELRRILRPGGRLYVTVHDNHTIQVLLSAPPGHWLHDTAIRKQLQDYEAETSFLEKGFRFFVLSREPGNAQVFHDAGYIRHAWGQFLQVLSITPDAYGYQSAVTLTR